MRDIHSKIEVVEALAPAVYVDDNEPAAIDLAGFEAAEILLHIGAGGIAFTGTNKIEFILSHSDDNLTYAPVESADLVSKPAIATGGIIKALTAAHAAATLDKFGYIGGKRYLKLLADFGGVHETGTPLAAIVVKGRPHHMG